MSLLLTMQSCLLIFTHPNMAALASTGQMLISQFVIKLVRKLTILLRSSNIVIVKIFFSKVMFFILF